MPSVDTAPFTWQISNSPYPSPFLPESKVFGKDNPAFLVDQYSGRRPALLNAEFVRKGTLELKFFASALLDSNLANQLHAIAYGGKVNDGFSDLFQFLTRGGWDFSLYFYYMEHFCKSTREDFAANAGSRTRALLRLQSMDEQHFLRTGAIVENPTALEHYLSLHSVSSLDEAAAKRVDNFCDGFSRSDAIEHVESIEIALAKMVLIRRFEMPRKSPEKQLDAFLTFLHRDLDAMLAREAHLSLHYFFDHAGRLLGIQPNTPWESAHRVLQSTAWDMYFLRLPELLLSANSREICLSFIATQEKQLYQLASLFTVEAVSGLPDGSTLPTIGYSLRDLPERAKAIQLPPRTPNLKRRTAPTGLRDALFAELRRNLPQ